MRGAVMGLVDYLREVRNLLGPDADATEGFAG
jgi:hypothetical protein